MKTTQHARLHRPRACALAVMTLMTMLGAHAQEASAPARGAAFAPLFAPTRAPSAAPQVYLGQGYAANAQVGQIRVEVQGAQAPADGVTPTTVVVRVYDKDGLLLTDPVMVTIEHTGHARLQLPDALTDEFGAGRGDGDRRMPGTQLRVVGGEARFSLIAPPAPEDVSLRLTVGAVDVQGVIPFTPDLREMIATGMVEGVIKITRRDYESTVAPARIEDGFEADLKHFSRTFNDGKGQAGARAAFFLKGKIRGDALLTLAYDSDKSQPARSLNGVKPEEFYPVYGDASVKGAEALSASRLYVRVDQGRSYVLYGDFSTANPATVLGGGNALRQLGAYTRNMTGARAHLETGGVSANVYASRDTLSHATDEIPANGTSGPFAVRAATAVEGSEQVQLVVRDKGNLGRVLSVTTLVRVNDYTFEPFSGRILLHRAVPSQDSDGNPTYLRIDYEMDQGGSAFWVAGGDVQANVGESVTVGGSVVNDANPSARFRMASVNAGAKLGEHTRVIAEAAVTDADLGAIRAASTTSLSAMPGEMVKGRAGRVELQHESDAVKARVYWSRTGSSFANAAAGAQPGSQQVGADVKVKATDDLVLKASAQRIDDTVTDARQTGATVGAEYQLTPSVSVGGGFRHITEVGRVSGMLTSLGNNPSAGSYFGPGAQGGFAGAGSSTLLNLNSALATTGSAPGTVPDLDANTVYVDGRVKLGDSLTVYGLAEAGNDSRRRAELGVSYQIGERARVYLRGESQSGLSSQYGLDTAAHGSAISLGIDSNYMEGGNVFSEYRLRDASDGRSSQVATGVRNTWHIADGVGLTTGLERLKILDGTGQNATAATLGVDYTANENWKGSGRVEWRRLDAGTGSAIAQDSWLTTLTAARKLNRDWTALVRNYYLATNNHGAMANGWQDRFQIGAAYRPVDDNRLDVLGKYEYKAEDNILAQSESRRVHVAAVQANLHPSRPWWMSARLAAKSVNERFPANEGGGADQYKAALVSGRLVYDLTENWDVGAMVSVMRGSGGTTQHALGLEVGYLMGTNLWLSAGYNAAGFTDRDLTSDYTAQGAFLRLRYKFDADLFAGNNPDINRALPR